eukprot:6213383-Pleurochrysis_carterae.AAC.2
MVAMTARLLVREIAPRVVLQARLEQTVRGMRYTLVTTVRTLKAACASYSCWKRPKHEARARTCASDAGAFCNWLCVHASGFRAKGSGRGDGRTAQATEPLRVWQGTRGFRNGLC